MQPQILRRPVGVQDHLPSSLNPILRRVYAARGIRSLEELERDFRHLHDFRQLHGIDTCVQLLAEALAQQQRVIVVADFDADGATSCATLVRGLRSFGAKYVDFVVPNRFEYGYGLTPEIVALAAQRNPDLLITVDNGISSLEGVAAAKTRGFKVIITDHHLPGAELPAADAIVNPNQPGDTFPSKHLAGVGVVFYVLSALRAHLRDRGWFTSARLPEPNLASLLDLVALGTVADVATLDHCNRILVAQGVARLRRGGGCAGIQALLQVAKRNPAQVTAADLGFAVAPRLNAAGRLEDMTLGISCLLTDDPAEAAALAQQLDRLNEERREIEATMQQQAALHVQRCLESEESQQLPAGLCLHDPAWHPGVVGIVAGRVKDRFHRPVVAFAKVNEIELKGSARSISGVHIRDVLERVATQYPDIVKRFGGHAMAAGVSIEADQLARFASAFAEAVAAAVDPELLRPVILSDGELRREELSLGVAVALQDAGPWGHGFPEPVFDGVFDVLSQRVVGERHLKLLLRHPDGGDGVDAILFNAPEDCLDKPLKQAHLAYRLDVNEFRGNRRAQLILTHLQQL